MNKIGLLIGVVFSAAISGVLIWVVGKLGLGLEVDSIVTAFIVGITISVVGGLITWLLSFTTLKLGRGLLGAVLKYNPGGCSHADL